MKRQDNKSINSHTLWLELLNQRSFQSASVGKSKQYNGGNLESENKRSFYKTQEEYHDESIFLKKNIANLKGENDILKSKIRKDEEELLKKDKQMTEIINCIENQKATQDSSINNFIVLKKLKQNVFQLKADIKSKENDIINLKSDIKYTKINELMIQNDAYLQEVKSLQQLISNIRSNDIHNEQNSETIVYMPKPKMSKISGKSNITKKHKELLIENKLLKKDIDRYEQLKLSESDNLKRNSSRTDEEKILEIDRLKKICEERNGEKTELQNNYDNLSTKYNILKENMDKKEAECNLLKKRLEQKSLSKNEPQPQIDKSVDSNKNLNQELIQSIFRSYINREKLIEENDNIKQKDEDNLSKSDILQSAFIGYSIRKKILNN